MGESTGHQLDDNNHLSICYGILLLITTVTASIAAGLPRLYKMTFTLDDLPATPTPKDYSRIQFDPSQLPKERIVGILACQRAWPT